MRARAASASKRATAAIAIKTAAQASARSTISQYPCARSRSRAGSRNAIARPSPLQPHAAAPGLADGSLADQLNPRRRERIDELHQGIDVAADHPFARFHALDRGQRKPRALGEVALVDFQPRPRGPHLGTSNHASDIGIVILYIAIHS